MTQFFRDFQSDTVGAMPAGFSEQSSKGGYEVFDLGGTDGKVLAYIGDNNNNEYISWWSDPSGPGSILNGDVLVKFSQTQSGYDATGLDAFIASRIPDPLPTSNTNQIICAGLADQSTLRINQTRPFSSFATASVSFSAATNYYIRFNFNGTSYKAKWWLASDEEPSAWDIETTNSTDQDPGYIGTTRFKSEEMAWHWFSVSDDPAIAADNPDVASGPETPVSLSVTDILANSARLNWEQG